MIFECARAKTAGKSWNSLHRSCWVGPEISTLRTSPRMEVPLLETIIIKYSLEKEVWRIAYFWIHTTREIVVSKKYGRKYTELQLFLSNRNVQGLFFLINLFIFYNKVTRALIEFSPETEVRRFAHSWTLKNLWNCFVVT